MSKDKPFYVLHRDRVEKNIVDMQNAFKKLYCNFVIAYSFKTNYLRPIIDIIAEHGCMAEVVSPYEMQYAIELARFWPKVVYNGVIPDTKAKFATALNNGITNVDNMTEYHEISEMANSLKKHIDIGVRVNFPISNGLCSRFGVPTESEDFAVLMESIAADDYVHFGGFHCHIGTARPAKFWSEKSDTMIAMAKKYRAKYIDLGGGMYGPMIPELASQFSDYAETYDEYAEVVCPRMKEAFPDEEVMLIVEPGTALVGNTMDLYCHVTDIKNVRGKVFITVDTCSNHLGIICECRVIPMTVYHSNGERERVSVTDATISGCTCLEFDYIRKGYYGDIAIGDVIKFENVGAYSIGASRQFIVPRPAVLDAKDGTVLRKVETFDDMFTNYLCE